MHEKNLSTNTVNKCDQVLENLATFWALANLWENNLQFFE